MDRIKVKVRGEEEQNALGPQTMGHALMYLACSQGYTPIKLLEVRPDRQDERESLYVAVSPTKLMTSFPLWRHDSYFLVSVIRDGA